MAVVSWIPLAYFVLSLLGSRPDGGPIIENIGSALLLLLPWFTVFASVSFLFDQRAVRWWVSPLNLAILVLSIGPSVVLGLLQLAAFWFLIAGPLLVG